MSRKGKLKGNIDLLNKQVENLVETYGYSLVEYGKYYGALYIKDYFDYYKNSPDFLFKNTIFSQVIDCFAKFTKYENCSLAAMKMSMNSRKENAI